MTEHFSGTTDPQEMKEITFTADEVNVMRYASGFVPYKLLRKYELESGEKVHFVACLQGMSVSYGSNQTDFLECTKSWLDKVNRGGLLTMKCSVCS